MTQTFNSVNQNTFGGTVTFDANGNPQSWNGAALTYDANNKLVSISTALTAGFGRDGLRAWKQNSAGTRAYFLYDGLVPVCELDGSGNVTAVNTVGPTGVLARHTNWVGGGSVFYAFDPQGSVAVRLDTSGNVLSSHVNEAWGTQVSSGSGYTSDPYAGYGGQWGYYRDVETGLHLLGHRYYDVAQGRFINRDPIGYRGGINLYAYCDNNPVDGADPSGFLAPSVPMLCRLVVSGVAGAGEVGGAAIIGPGMAAGTAGWYIGSPIGNWIANKWFGPEVDTPEAEEADQPTFPSYGSKPKQYSPDCITNGSTQDNPTSTAYKNLHPRWNQDIEKTCDDLREMKKAAKTPAEKNEIKQAMKFMGCDGKDRGAGDVRPK